MGLFDKMFSTATVELANEQEAVFAIIQASVAADGEIEDSEITSMVHVLIKREIFKGAKIEDMYRKISKVQKSVGAKGLVDAAAALVNPKRKGGVFAIAVDMMLADGTVGDKEKEMLEHIQTSLGISDETASKIVEVSLLKNSL